MIVNMRSSDLIFGIAYDIPAFTFFQEMLALELGVGLGTYTHCSNSLHIYERHFKMARTILADRGIEESITSSTHNGAMPAFKPLDFLEGEKERWLNKVTAFENSLRNSETEGEINDLLQGLYHGSDRNIWTDFASLLAYHRAKKLGMHKQILEKLDFDYSGYKVDLRRTNEV